jgi:hypothetical protein
MQKSGAVWGKEKTSRKDVRNKFSHGLDGATSLLFTGM